MAEGVLLREGGRAVCVPPELDGRYACGSGADFLICFLLILLFCVFFVEFVKQLLFLLFERDNVTDLVARILGNRKGGYVVYFDVKGEGVTAV